MKSIIQTKKECFECMNYSNLEEHHIFFRFGKQEIIGTRWIKSMAMSQSS